MKAPLLLPPLPATPGAPESVSCVEIFSLGLCSADFVGNYYKTGRLFNERPVWATPGDAAELVYHAHDYGWWLKHSKRKKRGSLAGSGFPCMGGDRHHSSPAGCEYFAGRNECGLRKCADAAGAELPGKAEASGQGMSSAA